MDNNYILQMKNIRITFGALVANDNVNLNVKKGTVHALIGENGAGKSTLMNVLTGILRPDCGEIILNGEEVPAGAWRPADPRLLHRGGC